MVAAHDGIAKRALAGGGARIEAGGFLRHMPMTSRDNQPKATQILHPQPIRFGPVNWVGLGALYMKEVRRFLVVATQTILAPMVTTLLFLAIFVLALGGSVRHVDGVPYSEFLAPGLVMMAITQNAFANTSSSILIAKIQGNIVDFLMPPLSPLERLSGIALGGLTRGLVVGLTTGLAMLPFIAIQVQHPFFVLFHAINASLLLSLIGLLTGIWSEKFDHLAGITNFIITPLAFLSGTFYSAEHLPVFWQWIAHLNPFFYMIDGFRYASSAAPTARWRRGSWSCRVATWH
jgi:ABC-2 type transport system permease protein